MLMPIARRNPVRDVAETVYARIVDQARQPAFFAVYGVPDTFDGRFELICLHAFLVLHRFKAERPRLARLSQVLFDTMFADFDRSIREIGVGDLSVGKHVKRMARGFYGRIRAYQEGIESGDPVLEAALARNLYGTVRGARAPIGAMIGYLRGAVAELSRQDAAELMMGRVCFPLPELDTTVACAATSSAAR
jgi:cytochrome b pre-mRNA-processing protein 3